MKGDYEDFHALKAAKKQSQFKANFIRNEGFLLMAQEITTALRASQWQGKGIWKNKANFRIVTMSISIYMKGDYEEFNALKAAENKPNSKPNLFSPQIFWGLKNQFEKTKPILIGGKWT